MRRRSGSMFVSVKSVLLSLPLNPPYPPLQKGGYRGDLATVVAALTLTLLFLSLLGDSSVAAEGEKEVSEVIAETGTQVIVREHPMTGRPYVSIVSFVDPIPRDPFTGKRKVAWRPDYRMLDPNIKEGEIPYAGPVSDRRKVYLFAATLMTAGAVGGTVGIATAPVSGAGAATGGTGYVAAGSTVAGGAVAGTTLASRASPEEEAFKREAESKLDLGSVRARSASSDGEKQKEQKKEGASNELS